MTETNSPEAVALELLKILIAREPNIIVDVAKEDIKGPLFALYRECLAVVKEGR